MKKLFVLVSGLFLISCGSGALNSSTEASTIKYQLRGYTTEKLENELQIIYIPETTLPSISYGMLIKSGSSGDPMGKSGLIRMMAQLTEKGAAGKNANQIADSLGQLGTNFEQMVSEDFLWFQIAGLSFHQSQLLDIFTDIVLKPTFDTSEINREKDLTLAAIKALSDNPQAYASEEFEGFLFGAHPYGRPNLGYSADVASMNKADMVKVYNKVVRPNNAILVVTGQINDSTKKAIAEKFGKWKVQKVDAPVYTLSPPVKGLQIRLLNKNDLTQSQVILGHLGIKRVDPDFLKLRIANTILGGNFSSRLMDQVRVNLGLTYGISSQFDARVDRGPFIIASSTRNEMVGKAIKETLNVVQKFVEDGVTSKEVEDTKNYLLGAFPRAIETPEKLGFNIALLRLYGVDEVYLKDYAKNIGEISVKDVNQAIKAHFSMKDFKVLVLSKYSDAIEQLRPLGSVETKEIK